MVPYRYKEPSVFYSVLAEDAEVYEEPFLNILYEQAVADLKELNTEADYQAGKPGNILLRMARVEAIKEMNMLQEIFGINLGISFKTAQDVKDLVEAINSVFHFTHNIAGIHTAVQLPAG